MYSFSQKLANEKFGFSDTLTIVENIVSRAEDEKFDTYDNLYDEISNCMDEELIYTQDQWTVIQFYSSPDNPMDIYDATKELVTDIINCYEEI